MDVDEERKGLTLNGRGYDGEINLACPVCDFEYCHVVEVVFLPRTEGGPLTGLGAEVRREGYLTIRVEGECSHNWVVTINQHKGVEMVTTQRLHDS